MNSHPRVLLSRRTSFQLGRQINHPDWDAEKNFAVFGLDARPHGHEYTLDVAFGGPISPDDGMIVNLSDLKPILACAVAPLHEAWLPGEHPAFVDKRPTAENIARTLWESLPKNVAGAALKRLRLQESRRMRVEMKGQTLMKISRSYEFAAAHRLFAPGLSDQENLTRFDKCSNPAGHGHNYNLEVAVSGQPDAETGFIIAPKKLDEVVDEEVFARFDHKHLNVDCPEFTQTGLIPTSENLAQVIFDLLKSRLEREGFQ
jgi:6-pyruvoyltetrahydropterin/6-carboxytetrahydropterin synthase